MITVHPRPDTLDRSTVEAYRSVAPATLGHALETAMEPSIRALWRPVKLVGPALTVETTRDLYAAVNEAVAIAQPGDVLVVATGRDPRHAITGEFTLRTAQEHGIAGMVVDALMADARALESMQFPVFCWGSSPALLSAVPRQSREPQGALNVPVEVGGVLVNPGDLVLADDDGVLIATPDEARAYLATCQAMEEGEEYARNQLAAGRRLSEVRREMDAAGTPLSVFRRPQGP